MQHLQPNTTLQGGKYRIERVQEQGDGRLCNKSTANSKKSSIFAA